MEQQMLRQEVIPVRGTETSEGRERIVHTASSVFGVQSASIESGVLRIEYDPYAVTIDYVKEEIARQGTEFTPSPKPTKNPFRRFLDSLIASNERVYGSDRLDCCKLNRKD